ncbi:hypothetical protein CDAR_87111 [Caerostris darwini]|uniref:Uncharacterized protein n=1 Tax=Caerostris darwini TaxID=1538125 RepID=A0AAV4U8D6_9ARAC|nr:hypothetical protein CDAR_87111 [Caerostris darwini]
MNCKIENQKSRVEWKQWHLISSTIWGFFYTYEDLLKKKSLNPERISNLDERTAYMNLVDVICMPPFTQNKSLHLYDAPDNSLVHDLYEYRFKMDVQFCL